jgi:Domain of unknown function (DUF4177)
MKYEYLVLYDAHDASNEIDAHQQILNSYGEKGWDLVQVIYPVPTLCGPTSFVYFFKRALGDSESAKKANETELDR